MDSALKQRLIGAAVLVALAMIFLPMLLKGPDTAEPDAARVPLEMPSAPDQEFETRELPLVAPSPVTAEGGVLGMETRPAARSDDPNAVATVDQTGQPAAAHRLRPGGRARRPHRPPAPCRPWTPPPAWPQAPVAAATRRRACRDPRRRPPPRLPRARRHAAAGPAAGQRRRRPLRGERRQLLQPRQRPRPGRSPARGGAAADQRVGGRGRQAGDAPARGPVRRPHRRRSRAPARGVGGRRLGHAWWRWTAPRARPPPRPRRGPPRPRLRRAPPPPAASASPCSWAP